MAGNEHDDELNVDWAAAARLDALMSDRGWSPRDVERASRKTGHPMRRATYRVIYRVLNEGHKPRRSTRYEIACALGVKPSEIWRPSDPNGALADASMPVAA